MADLARFLRIREKTMVHVSLALQKFTGEAWEGKSQKCTENSREEAWEGKSQKCTENSREEAWEGKSQNLFFSLKSPTE